MAALLGNMSCIVPFLQPGVWIEISTICINSLVYLVLLFTNCIVLEATSLSLHPHTGECDGLVVELSCVLQQEAHSPQSTG